MPWSLILVLAIWMVSPATTRGLPESVHIELSRDLNKSTEARDEISWEIKKNQDETERAAEKLVEIDVPVNRLNLQKYKLWQEQGCVCAYTLKCLNLETLPSSSARLRRPTLCLMIFSLL